MELLDEMWIEILTKREAPIATIRLVCKFWNETVYKRFVQNPRDITYKDYMKSGQVGAWYILYMRSLKLGLFVSEDMIQGEGYDRQCALVSEHKESVDSIHKRSGSGKILTFLMLLAEFRQNNPVTFVVPELPRKQYVTRVSNRIEPINVIEEQLPHKEVPRVLVKTQPCKRVPQKWTRRTDTRQNMKLNRRMHM